MGNWWLQKVLFHGCRVGELEEVLDNFYVEDQMYDFQGRVCSVVKGSECGPLC